MSTREANNEVIGVVLHEFSDPTDPSIKKICDCLLTSHERNSGDTRIPWVAMIRGVSKLWHALAKCSADSPSGADVMPTHMNSCARLIMGAAGTKP